MILHLLSISLLFVAYCVHGTPYGAIIGNSEVIMGVGSYGSLNVPYRAVSAFSLPNVDPTGLEAVGLRSRRNEYFNSVEAGVQCEGWGVRMHHKFGGSSRCKYGDYGFNLNLVSFAGTDGASVATSIVRDTTDSFQVSHDFYASPHSQYVFECDVTITNLLAVRSERARYRRVLDWDMWPSLFNEYITIWGTQTVPNLILSNDNGFCFPDPSSYCSPLIAANNIDFEDSGPADHGAQFTLDFGPLNGYESASFKIFFGVSDGETAAEVALGAVGSELFSIAQQAGDPTEGLPFTAIFGFGDVGGEDFAPCGECVTSCTDLAAGNYRACNACNVFVSCSVGGIFSQTTCPEPLVWNDALKICDWDSHCNFGLCNTESLQDVDATPARCGDCVSDCTNVDLGDYISCSGTAAQYASCGAGGILYDFRPCGAGTVWDDMLKICNWVSSC